MPVWFDPGTAHTALFCVVGSPVTHSRSPFIHHAFAAQCGITLHYEKVEVAAGSLAAALDEFRACGGRGMNVTVPLKTEAHGLATILTPRARAAGAVNTLWFDADDALAGDNTDGVGLVRDLQSNLDLDLAGRDVLLLGAGGAARGVVPALLEAAPRRLTISNRTRAGAEAIASAFRAQAHIEVLPWGAAAGTAPDLIVNATSLSLHGEAPPLAAGMLRADAVCYDMMYSAAPTAFVAAALRAGVERAFDGLGMLVEQAAEAFSIWHGVRPATAALIARMRRGED